jgi:hypothetical protein
MGRKLVVHAAHGTPLVAESYIHLHHVRVEFMLFKLLVAPRPGKIPPVVFDLPEPNDAGPFQGRFSEFHFDGENASAVS